MLALLLAVVLAPAALAGSRSRPAPVEPSLRCSNVRFDHERQGAEQPGAERQEAAPQSTEGERAADPDASQGDGQTPPSPQDELARLRAKLDKSGPDGKEERESAIVQLLAKPIPEAHALLAERLRRSEDPDRVRSSILDALQQHLLIAQEQQFGGAEGDGRREILTGYLRACAPFWCNAPPIDEPGTAPERELARTALQRVEVRQLAEAAEEVFAAGDAGERAAVVRCLADMRQTLLAATIAKQLDAPEEIVREAARDALELLTFAVPAIRSKADFDAWHAVYGNTRYVALMERAARSGTQRFERLQQQLAEEQVRAARDIVTVHVRARDGIDWAAVQARTLSDGPAVLDACLEALREMLSQAGLPQGGTAARHTFCRALLARLNGMSSASLPEVQRRRAQLLEVAAYLVRPDEADIATEIRALLLQELASPSALAHIPALRGLRRFPSVEARQALVALAHQLLVDPAANREQLIAIFDTLASRSEPRWHAPASEAPDKQQWLDLIRIGARTDDALGLRGSALLLAQTNDKTQQRVPEAFDIVLELAGDETCSTEYRKNCLIYLESWNSQSKLTSRWANALLQFVEHAKDPVLRLEAVTSMVRLPETLDSGMETWIPNALKMLRRRLLEESDRRVLKALVDCVEFLARKSDMAGNAIGVLTYALDQVAPKGRVVSEEDAFRLEPLLQALATVAADPGVPPSQWLVAADALVQHGKRPSLRLLLQNHNAIGLARYVDGSGGAASNGESAEHAARAMNLVIETAALKTPPGGWNDSDELKNEARDVRAAFTALDKLAADRRPGKPHVLLRASVDLANGKNQEVVQRVQAWLNDPRIGDEAVRDELRYHAAEAQLALSRPTEALAMLRQRSADRANQPRVVGLTFRIAQALADADVATAATLFESVLQATPTEDPQFRPRLLAWMRARLRQSPNDRDRILTETARHAPLFEAADCPAKERQEWQQLRSSN